jgi:hypothetical protein
MNGLENMTSCQKITIATIAIIVIYLLFFANKTKENFCGMSEDCGQGITRNYYGNDNDYSTCLKTKKIYLNSDDCDEKTGHGDCLLEKRYGKLYITLNCNLPYAQGGTFHTMWGAYHAFLHDTKTNEQLYLGSLVRHGDRFYKLNTELLGDYRNFNEIVILRKTEDYPMVKVLKGSIECSGNGN